MTTSKRLFYQVRGTIVCLLAENGIYTADLPTNHGWGIYSAEEWRDMGHDISDNVVAAVWHEGSKADAYFCSTVCYRQGDYAPLEAMIEALHPLGVHSEKDNNCLSLIYRSR